MQLQHRFVDALPGDPETEVFPRQVHGAAFSEVRPTPVSDPALLAWSDDVARSLGVDAPAPYLATLAGNHVPEGARPYAACYGGHQFGVWAGQLGDGRAITLGEVEGPGGVLEVQLKGAGPTPYSRTADGRAVLRSSVREFLCSEAMHHLGIPTTRALSLVTTGDDVLRDMFYDGRPKLEPGAVVARVAPSFLRFGSYEIHAARRDEGLLRQLVHHTLVAHFPELPCADADALGPDQVLPWLHEVARRSARLVAAWQGVGFTHGVLNTDNLSILGLTIDYGPYGWLEGYDPAYTPNTSDLPARRYAYGQQPFVVGWNVARLLEACLPLVGEVPLLQEVLDGYGEDLGASLRTTLRGKLGLVADEGAADDGLLDTLPGLLAQPVTDWTHFHRLLARVRPPTVDDDVAWVAQVAPAFYGEPNEQELGAWAAWLRRWDRRSSADHEGRDARQASMDAVNPRIVLRNWIVQQAIEAAEGGDPQPVRDLLQAVQAPFEPVQDDPYDALEPTWARNRPGCSLLSCSS